MAVKSVKRRSHEASLQATSPRGARLACECFRQSSRIFILYNCMKVAFPFCVTMFCNVHALPAYSICRVFFRYWKYCMTPIVMILITKQVVTYYKRQCTNWNENHKFTIKPQQSFYQNQFSILNYMIFSVQTFSLRTKNSIQMAWRLQFNTVATANGPTWNGSKFKTSHF